MISRLVAALFAVESTWLVLRFLDRVADGRAVWTWPLFVGLLFPASLGGAAWFVWRRRPPTLLVAALIRTIVMTIALLTNLILAIELANGHFRAWG